MYQETRVLFHAKSRAANSEANCIFICGLSSVETLDYRIRVTPEQIDQLSHQLWFLWSRIYIHPTITYYSNINSPRLVGINNHTSNNC